MPERGWLAAGVSLSFPRKDLRIWPWARQALPSAISHLDCRLLDASAEHGRTPALEAALSIGRVFDSEKDCENEIVKELGALEWSEEDVRKVAKKIIAEFSKKVPPRDSFRSMNGGGESGGFTELLIPDLFISKRYAIRIDHWDLIEAVIKAVCALDNDQPEKVLLDVFHLAIEATRKGVEVDPIEYQVLYHLRKGGNGQSSGVAANELQERLNAGQTTGEWTDEQVEQQLKKLETKRNAHGQIPLVERCDDGTWISLV